MTAASHPGVRIVDRCAWHKLRLLHRRLGRLIPDPAAAPRLRVDAAGNVALRPAGRERAVGGEVAFLGAGRAVLPEVAALVARLPGACRLELGLLPGPAAAWAVEVVDGDETALLAARADGPEGLADLRRRLERLLLLPGTGRGPLDLYRVELRLPDGTLPRQERVCAASARDAAVLAVAACLDATGREAVVAGVAAIACGDTSAAMLARLLIARQDRPATSA